MEKLKITTDIARGHGTFLFLVNLDFLMLSHTEVVYGQVQRLRLLREKSTA